MSTEKGTRPRVYTIKITHSTNPLITKYAYSVDIIPYHLCWWKCAAIQLYDVKKCHRSEKIVCGWEERSVWLACEIESWISIGKDELKVGLCWNRESAQEMLSEGWSDLMVLRIIECEFDRIKFWSLCSDRPIAAGDCIKPVVTV